MSILIVSKLNCLFYISPVSSSFIKNISGDKKLSIIEKVYWFIISLINLYNFKKKFNKFPIKKKNFLSKKSYKLKKLNTNVSPIRNICNLFWENLNWSQIIKNLKHIKILEVGCGSGRYGVLLQKLIKNNFVSYTGIDISDKKFMKRKKFYFFKDGYNNLHKYIKNINFLFTQSAVEHFEDDVKFFKIISNKINKSKKKFLQVHLVPSNYCLKTYLFHGYRHYDFYKISKLIGVFNKNTKCFLVPLGGKNINKIFFNKITIPRMFGLNQKKIKKNEVLKAVKDDMANNNAQASFYAIVLLTNFELENLF